MTAIEKPLAAARTFIKNCALEGETVVDATAGNGHDTVFLAQLVGEKGRVIAFDIQKTALDNTKNRLIEKNQLDRVCLLLSGHEHADEFIEEDIAAAMFNLGYLPGANHGTTTYPETTIKAINILIDKLKPGGIITLVAYTGHPGGYEEKRAVFDFCFKLAQTRYTVLSYEIINQANNPPSLLVIEKHKMIEKD